MDSIKVIQLLKRARALITHRYLIHEMAMLPNGISTRPDDPNAVVFCPVGVLIHFRPEYGKLVEHALVGLHTLAKEAGEGSLGEFTYHRPHNEVLSIYDKAIKKVKEDPSIFKVPIRKKKCRRLIVGRAEI